MGLPRELFLADPSAYLAAVREYADGYELNENEDACVGWMVFANGGRSDDLHAVLHAGYLIGQFEDWRPDPADVPIGLFPGHRRNERDRYLEMGIPDDLVDDVYATGIIRVRIEKFAAPDDSDLRSRLDYVFENGILPMYADDHQPTGEMREMVRTFFEEGVALAVFSIWAEQMEQRGYEGEALWQGELEFIQEKPDSLAHLDLPLSTSNGCVLERHDIRGYVLRYQGRLGGGNITQFTAEGECANIAQMLKEGKLGNRPTEVPLPRHVDALRELGFVEMERPNGKRYRLSSWGGLSGVRKIKD